MAELVGIQNLKMVKISTSSSGVNAYAYKLAESCISYIVDDSDHSKFILSHTCYRSGGNPIQSVIKNNILTFGANNSYGTQVIEGTSGNVIFYLLYFV